MGRNNIASGHPIGPFEEAAYYKCHCELHTFFHEVKQSRKDQKRYSLIGFSWVATSQAPRNDAYASVFSGLPRPTKTKSVGLARHCCVDTKKARKNKGL
jgi:hypothetical protein